MFSISLTNFRSFRNQTFNFSKFNVLIGENSSGKSSLFKFILALKQTLQAPSNREINLLFKGEYADLGSYKESVYYHDDELPMSFKFSFGAAYYAFFMNFMTDGFGKHEQKEIERLNKLIDGPIKTSTEISFELTKELNIHHSIKTQIKNVSIGELVIEHFADDPSSDKSLIFDSRCNLKFLDSTDRIVYEIKDIQYSKDGFMSILDGSSLFSQVKKLLNVSEKALETESEEDELRRFKAESIIHKIAYLIITQNYLKFILDSIEYINPINTHPSRVYLYKDLKRITTINDLDDVVEFFSRNDEGTKLIFDEFVLILKNLGIAQDIEIIQDERLPVRELRVQVKDLLSNINDVGYGVSLQLPIILKALLADRIRGKGRKLIMIEQPEVHLHPKLHAELINALLMLSENTIYFIETHSEHIIRKLQVMVKQKSYGLIPKDVTIHYLLRVERQSEVSSHRIETTGMLNPPFPSGFFDNSFVLSKQLLS